MSTWALLSLLLASTPAAGTPPVRRVVREAFCVTTGEIRTLSGNRLGIDSPKVRAVIREAVPQSAEMRFTYLGPSAGSAPLASGEMRRQIGLKLRAQDGCNLVYAMWRIEPESRLVVSVKRNPGKHTHAECGTSGYVNVKPRRSVAVPRLAPGATHVLAARLRRDDLQVLVDGSVVWEGALGPQALEFDGTVGLRTDNARFEIEFGVGGPEAGPVSPVPASIRDRCGEDKGGD